MTQDPEHGLRQNESNVQDRADGEGRPEVGGGVVMMAMSMIMMMTVSMIMPVVMAMIVMIGVRGRLGVIVVVIVGMVVWAHVASAYPEPPRDPTSRSARDRPWPPGLEGFSSRA
jgi:hypothetical protein